METPIDEISKYKFDPKNEMDYISDWEKEQEDIYEYIEAARKVRIDELEIYFPHIRRYKIENYLQNLVEDKRIFKQGLEYVLKKSVETKKTSLIQTALSKMLQDVDMDNYHMKCRSGFSETEISSLKNGKRPIKLEKAFYFAEKLGKSQELLNELISVINNFTNSVNKEIELTNQLELFND
jgi:hypothetical protein